MEKCKVDTGARLNVLVKIGTALGEERRLTIAPEPLVAAFRRAFMKERKFNGFIPAALFRLLRTEPDIVEMLSARK